MRLALIKGYICLNNIIQTDKLRYGKQKYQYERFGRLLTLKHRENDRLERESLPTLTVLEYFLSSVIE